MFTKTLLPAALRAIQLAATNSVVKDAYLAGGTALALQIGHRISLDLDFFTFHEFNVKELNTSLSQLPEFTSEQTSKWTVLGKLNTTKFSFFYYKYPLISETITFEGIQLASLSDIAAMKINALESRGTRRDFIDVYLLAKQFSLDEMLKFYDQKYGTLENNFYSIIRSLNYFDDAEKESEMPKMLIPISWDEVKTFFEDQVKRLAKSKLGIT